MNVDDLNDLWVPAAKGIYPQEVSYGLNQLEVDLDTKCFTEYIRRLAHHDFPMASDPAEAAFIPILKALAGPHGKTLLKVWKIQKGRAA